MENEKRKVGDYTVLCAVNIGSREIILAENEQSTNGERFSAATESATTYLKSLPNALLAAIILMLPCSLQNASSKTPKSSEQRLKSWIFP